MVLYLLSVIGLRFGHWVFCVMGNLGYGYWLWFHVILLYNYDVFLYKALELIQLVIATDSSRGAAQRIIAAARGTCIYERRPAIR